MSEDLIKKSLNTGDILLFTSSDHWYDILVRKCTYSEYSHSAMVLRDPVYIDPKLTGLYLIQSDSSLKQDAEDGKHKFGVQIIPFDDIFSSGYEEVYVQRLETDRNEEFNEKLKEVHSKVHNAPYDLNLFNWFVCGLYHLGISDRMVEKHTNRFWCSALVGYIYNQLGLVDEKVDWSNLAPVDFTKDEFINEIIKPSKLNKVEVLYKFK